MAKTLLLAADLWRSFQRERGVVVAVQGCSFRISAGETIAIMGPSGCGKTTLLNLIAGLDMPSSGRLERPGSGSPDTLRPERIGVVFQSANLIPALTALENVELPILLGNGSEANARALTALATFGVDSLAQKLPAQLSGGEQQRVALARAFNGRPALLFADEPTGNLDRQTGDKIADLLFSMNQQYGTTLILVTHDPQLAARCDRRLRLVNGELREEV